jgi:hypothetical protein
MNIRILPLALLLCSTTGFAQRQPSDPTAKALENLARIEALYFPRLSPDERKAAILLMNETRLSFVGQYERPVGPTKHHDLNVLNDSAFQKLLASVKKEISGPTKTKLVLAIGKKGKVTSSQVAALIETYSFDSDRSELLRALADNIVDPVNIGMALDHYDNSLVRDEMAEFFRDR